MDGRGRPRTVLAIARSVAVRRSAACSLVEWPSLVLISIAGPGSGFGDLSTSLYIRASAVLSARPIVGRVGDWNARTCPKCVLKPLSSIRSRRRTPSDLHFCWWPQRDLNPCYRLERSERSVSSSFEPY